MDLRHLRHSRGKCPLFLRCQQTVVLRILAYLNRSGCVRPFYCWHQDVFMPRRVTSSTLKIWTCLVIVRLGSRTILTRRSHWYMCKRPYAATIQIRLLELCLHSRVYDLTYIVYFLLDQCLVLCSLECSETATICYVIYLNYN